MKDDSPTVSLTCLEGNARLIRGGLLPGGYRALVLTGKRRRPDPVHWALIGQEYHYNKDAAQMACNVQGLYRGRCGDATVEASELYRGFLAIGCPEEAESLAKACAANGVFLKNA